MVYIAHELTQVSSSDVVVFSNCEDVRLTWLGKVLGVQRAAAGFHGAPHPPFIFTNAFNFHELNRCWGNTTQRASLKWLRRA